ncbi:hypothetical protein [Streptomyces sp. NPDC006274]|uniref:hypothetical protein n=1 Tax=unclassified Streptomyces TaxID=2593676 RepID=UPI0033AE99D5
MGEYAASLRACDRLLAMPDLPDAYRRQTVVNRRFAQGRAPSRKKAVGLPR